MTTFLRRSIWLSRAVLGAATLLFTRIAIEYVVDPRGAVAAHGVTLGSTEALTNTRVSGSMFLGMAIVLVGCLVSRRRVLAGLWFLTTISLTVLAIRLVGLAADGPAPFTLWVLKPEVVLAVLSGLALYFERRRRQLPDAAPTTRAGRIPVALSGRP